MAESITDGNQIRSEFDNFYILLHDLFGSCSKYLDRINREELLVKFGSLSAEERQRFVNLLLSADDADKCGIRLALMSESPTVDMLFKDLEERCARNRRYENNRLMSSLEDFLPLRYKAFCDNNRDAIREKILSLPDRQCRWYLDSIGDNPSQFGRRFNCFLHCRNISVCSIFSALYKAAGGVASGIFPYADPGASSSSTAAVCHAYNGTYCTSQSPYSSGGVASGIFLYADPGASSSSTAAVYHAYNGTYRTLRSPYSSDTGNRHNSPNRQREFTVLSNSLPDSVAHIQSHSPRPAASLNNPPGHGRVSIIPTDSDFTSGHGTIGNSPGRPRAFNIVTSNSLPDHVDHIQSSRRLAAPLNNPPGHDREVIIQLNGTIPAEAIRATRDDEAAGNADLFKILVPASLTAAYMARSILDSIHNGGLPFSIKTYGYLTVVLAGAAVLSSLVGLSLSTFKPETLPFGGSPQRMMQIMHNVGVHGLAYGFIGTMCHPYLQVDPFTFWIVAGLASAIFMTLMTFIGRRRGGQGAFHTDVHPC